MQALSEVSVVGAHGLQSTGSIVVAHRLSCSKACGIFPDQGSNPCLLHWQILNHWTTNEVPRTGIFKNKDTLCLLNAFENRVHMMKRVLMGRRLVPLDFLV